MNLKHFPTLIYMALAFFLGGCSVVDHKTDTGVYRTLADWKMRADMAKSSPEYTKARIHVNAWITSKQTAVQVAATDLFTTIDLAPIPDDLTKEVEKAIGTPPLSSLPIDILNWLLEQYKKQRADEAGAVVGRLNAFMWDEKKPSP